MRTTTTTKGLRAAVEVERSLSRSQARAVGRPRAGPGKRHPARGTPRAQPRDVRSAGRDTWNLTGVRPSAAPPKAIIMETVLPREIGAPLGHPGRSLRCPRPPRTLRSRRARPDTHESAPYSAADASGSSCAAGARLR